MLFRRMFCRNFSEDDPRIFDRAVSLYVKNIVVGLFCTVFMMLFSYMQESLINSGVSCVLSFLCVFSAAFISVLLMYVPMIASIHRARIFSNWHALRSDVLSLSFKWATLRALLFSGFGYALISLPSYKAIIKIAFTVASFLGWQYMIFKAINIVCNMGSDEKIPLGKVITKKSDFFIETAMCTFGLLVAFPFIIEEYFFKEYGTISRWPEAQKILFSQNVPLLYTFFVLPFTICLACCCYHEALEYKNQ